MAEKSIFPVGDHFPRPYDANFSRPENGRKIDFPVGDHFPRPYDANFRGTTNNPFRWQRPLGKFIFVLFCCCIRRDEEKETHNINVVGKKKSTKIEEKTTKRQQRTTKATNQSTTELTNYKKQLKMNGKITEINKR